MTTPAALRELSLAEAIDVFDQSAERTTPNRQTQAWAVIRAELKRQQATQLRTAASEGGEELVVGEDGWIDPATRDNESLVQCALENYARASHYRNIGQHNAAMACKAELLRRLTHPPEVARDAGRLVCIHRATDARYDHVVCIDCGSIRTDSAWGIAANQWFPSVVVAKFYKQNGRLPDAISGAAREG